MRVFALADWPGIRPPLSHTSRGDSFLNVPAATRKRERTTFCGRGLWIAGMELAESQAFCPVDSGGKLPVPISFHPWSMAPMGFRRLETLLDISRQGYWLKLECPCGHTARHDPMIMLERLLRRGGDPRLSHLHKSMRCGKCGGREFRVVHCNGPESWSR